MKNLNKNWLKDKVDDYTIEELERIKSEIIKCGDTYKNVFNGAPFYESWSLESALEEINSYIEDNALILTSKFREQIIGFLVAINKVPDDQRQYAQYLENIKFIEEIGVLNEFRKNGVASEMVRILLLKYLRSDDMYIGYRTNAMRYFDYGGSESFESAVMRVQKEDNIKRINKEKIIIPEFSENEKQKFINKYIELIKNRPDLDVSNSSALFRNIFGIIDYSKIDENYSFQKDPTGDGVELGICITPSFQDKHYGTEAIRTILDYAFNVLNIDEVFVVVFSNNARAIHCYNKIGFKVYKTVSDVKSVYGVGIDDIYMKMKKIDYFK